MNVLSKPILVFLSLVLIALSPLQAQKKFSGVFSISNFHINEANSGGTNFDYEGSTSFLLNARFFTKSRWAFRGGIGLDNLNYSVGNGVTTDYDAKRKDIKGVFGIEKHFDVAFLTLYPGLYVPITVVGEDVIQQNFDNIENGDLRAGLGFVAGANVKLFKILLVGVEFDAKFDDFQAGFRQGINELSFAPISGVNFDTAFTIGVAF